MRYLFWLLALAALAAGVVAWAPQPEPYALVLAAVLGGGFMAKRRTRL